MGKATFKHPGRSVDHTPASDVARGDVVVLGNRCGVAERGIAMGLLGALALDGVYDVVKITGEMSAGDKVYWDPDGDPHDGTSGSGALTKTATASTTYFGTVVKDAAGTDSKVLVKLDEVGRVATAQPDSVASTAAGAVVDLNALLAKLKAVGLMASS